MEKCMDFNQKCMDFEQKCMDFEVFCMDFKKNVWGISRRYVDR